MKTPLTNMVNTKNKISANGVNERAIQRSHLLPGNGNRQVGVVILLLEQPQEESTQENITALHVHIPKCYYQSNQKNIDYRRRM